MREVPPPGTAVGGFRSVPSWPVAYAGAHLEQGQAGPEALFPEESRFAEGMSPRRRLEFAAGRRCARAALAALDLPPADLPRGPSGQPLWPPGIAGSISHSEGRVCAAVSRKHLSLGIDIQSRSVAVDPLSWAEVGDPSEAAALRERGYPSDLAHYLLFSLREAAFKCLFPLFGRPASFRHLHLEFPDAPGRATVLARMPAGRDAPPWVCLQARFDHDEGFVLALAWLDASVRVPGEAT